MFANNPASSIYYEAKLRDAF
jgi:hypothetical protein